MPPPEPRIAVTVLLAGLLDRPAGASPADSPMARPVSFGSACYCRDSSGQQVWGDAT